MIMARSTAAAQPPSVSAIFSPIAPRGAQSPTGNAFAPPLICSQHNRHQSTHESAGRLLHSARFRNRGPRRFSHRLPGLDDQRAGYHLHEFPDVVGLAVPQSAGAADAPHALRFLERLRFPAENRAQARHPFGHHLLLLARYLDQRPAGAVHRFWHAHAIHRSQRQSAQHLSGRDTNDR